jgi:hypothetical protein
VPEGATNLYFTPARAAAAAPVQSVAGRTGAVTLTKVDVGLGNVDNTSDANKPISIATQTALNLKLGDAPSDGNQYVRKDAAWSILAASGGGIADAPSDGAYYVRRNAGWVDGDSAFATDVAVAGKVARAGDTMTGVLGLIDGTKAAPGLAFGSEPALGMFRPSAGIIGWVAGGQQVAALGAQSSTLTYWSMNSRAPAGQVMFQLVNDQSTATNYNSVSFGVDATHAFLNSTKGGSNTDKPLDFIGAAGYIFDNAIYSFAKAAGGAGIILCNNQPSGVTNYQRLQLGANASGVLIYGEGLGGAAKPPMYFDAASFSFTTGNIVVPALAASSQVTSPNYALTGGAVTNWVQDANNVYFQMAAGWFWSYAKATGALNWNTSTGKQTIFGPTGDFTAAGALVSSAANGPAMWWDGGNGNYLKMGGGGTTGGVWLWLWDRTSGLLSWINHLATPIIQFDSGGNAFKYSTGSAWLNISDERFKDVREAYTAGLPEILKLMPRWFSYKDTPDVKSAGLIAQEVRPVMPDMLSTKFVKRGDIELKDALVLDASNIQYALINAIKTIDARLKRLEQTA